MTYARNGVPVEGFTSMLWMLLCAASFFIGTNEPGLLVLSVILFTAAQCVLLGMVRRAVRENNPGDAEWPWAALLLAITLANPAHVIWPSITLMDTGLWLFLVVILTRIAVWPPQSRRGRGWIVLVVALAPLVRPEAMVVTPALIALFWWRSGTLDSEADRSLWCRNNRFVLLLAGIFILSLTGLVVFRLMYFGYPLPNTYYAKVSPSLWQTIRGGRAHLFDYAVSGVLPGLLILSATAIAAAWVGALLTTLARRRSLSAALAQPLSAVAAAALSASVLLLVPVFTGGDFFVMFRFFQPAYALTALTGVLALHASVAAGGYRQRYPLSGLPLFSRAAVLLVAGYWLFSYAFDIPWASLRWGWHHMTVSYFNVAEQHRQIGAHLGDMFAPEEAYPTIAVVAAGGSARTYPGPIIDVLGLNTVEFAQKRDNRDGKWGHAAFSAEVFYSLNPQILVVRLPETQDAAGFAAHALKDIFIQARFTEDWRFGVLFDPMMPERRVEAFYRKDLLDAIGLAQRLDFHETKVWTGIRWEGRETL